MQIELFADEIEMPPQTLRGVPADFEEKLQTAWQKGITLPFILQIEAEGEEEILFFSRKSTPEGLEAAKRSGGFSPDILRVHVKRPEQLHLQSDDGQSATVQIAQYWLELPALCYSVEGCIVAALGDDWRVLKGSVAAESIARRNKICQIPTPSEALLWLQSQKKTPRRQSRKVQSDHSSEIVSIALPVASEEFFISTAQETDALIRSAADGKRGGNWRNEIEMGKRIWESEDSPHRVELWRGDEVGDSPVAWEALEELTSDQNADFSLAMFYIAGLLCPPPGTQVERMGSAWVDLNDVMEKIGWLREKPNAEKLALLRRKLWRFLVFGEEARVIGQRGGRYLDKTTGQKISTYIESPVWRITDQRKPENAPDSVSSDRPIPVAVKVTVSDQFEQVFSAPQFAQYMPLGEILGAIPPNKVAGDWARVIGLTLAKIWRCKPRETQADTLRITRRELLTHFTPKTQSVREILESPNPKRAVEYYREALQILLEAGLIASHGDSAREMTTDRMLEAYGRKGWGEKWLSDFCALHPGPRWEPVVNQRAQALPPLKPRALNIASKAKARAPKKSKSAK